MALYLHLDSGRTWGGGQAQSLGLALALAERGERVHFLAQPGSALAAQLATSGLTWEVIPLRGLGGVLHSARLRARLRRLDPDIIHLHDSASQIPALWAAGRLRGYRRGRRPRIVTTRRVALPVVGKRRAYPYLLCDRVICISEAVRRRLLEAGVAPGRLCLIPDFVDCRHFAPTEAARAPAPTVIAVGRLTHEKGHAVLLKAMAEVISRLPEAKLVLVGRGDQEGALQAEANALGIAAAVSFAGFAADVRPALAAADVLAMPSLSEGLGAAVLEAMAMSKPVVASRVGGLQESVVDGETGLLMAPGDPPALAAALISLLEQPARAQAMGRAGRARALACFDRGPVVERVLALYREALAED